MDTCFCSHGDSNKEVSVYKNNGKLMQQNGKRKEDCKTLGDKHNKIMLDKILCQSSTSFKQTLL